MNFFGSKKSKPSLKTNMDASAVAPVDEAPVQEAPASFQAAPQDFDDMTAEKLSRAVAQINDPAEFAEKVQPRHIRKIADHIASEAKDVKNDLRIFRGVASSTGRQSLLESFTAGVVDAAIRKLENGQYASLPLLASVLSKPSARLLNSISGQAEKLSTEKNFAELEKLFTAGMESPEIFEKVSSFIPIETAKRLVKQGHNMRGLDVLFPFSDRSMVQLAYSNLGEKFKDTDIVAYQWISKILEAVDYVPERFPEPFVMEYPKGEKVQPKLRMTFNETSGKLFIEEIGVEPIHIGLNALKQAWRPANKNKENCDIVEAGIVRIAGYNNGAPDWTNGAYGEIPQFARDIAKRELREDQGVRDIRETPPRPTPRKGHFLPF